MHVTVSSFGNSVQSIDPSIIPRAKARPNAYVCRVSSGRVNPSMYVCVRAFDKTHRALPNTSSRKGQVVPSSQPASPVVGCRAGLRSFGSLSTLYFFTSPYDLLTPHKADGMLMPCHADSAPISRVGNREPFWRILPVTFFFSDLFTFVSLYSITFIT